MKKFILILTLLVSLSYAQAPDRRVYPMSRDAVWLIGTAPTGILESPTNGLLIGATAGQNSAAFSVKGYDGAVTLWLLGDTTGASVDLAQQSDSNLTVNLQLKNKDINVWGGYYSETTLNKTKLDTVDRAYINVAGTAAPYMILAAETAWATADSARFNFQIGTDDSLYFQAVIQGF